MRPVRPATFHGASFEAIGVTNQVIVLDAGALPRARELAAAEVVALDRACSRFRDDSELARLGSRAGRPVAVSPLLAEALAAALDAAADTEGLVDPTVGASMRALGYDRDFAVLVRARPRPRFELVPASGWRSVRLDRARRLVSVRAGTELDLGATAKAFAADRIARAVADEVGGPALVNLGGDVAVRGAPPEGWPVRVTDRHRDATGAGQTVAVRVGGLATSSTTVRRWRAGRVELHHVLDPRTGAPAPERWRTVSVAAGSCLSANAAATAAIVLGDAAPGWLAERGLAARLVARDGTVVTTGGWPKDERRDAR
jgi:thiamine biosynthesis lipoprotein